MASQSRYSNRDLAIHERETGTSPSGAVRNEYRDSFDIRDQYNPSTSTNYQQRQRPSNRSAANKDSNTRQSKVRSTGDAVERFALAASAQPRKSRLSNENVRFVTPSPGQQVQTAQPAVTGYNHASPDPQRPSSLQPQRPFAPSAAGNSSTALADWQLISSHEFFTSTPCGSTSQLPLDPKQSSTGTAQPPAAHLAHDSASSIGITTTQTLLDSESSSQNVKRNEAMRYYDEDVPESLDEQMVQQGIQHHEQGELVEATECFRKAAEMSNPNGMFLYGISLRHGWGCHPRPKAAFSYLQRAAESAIVDINNTDSNPPDSPSSSTSQETTVAKRELVLAIHELGVCFRHGWGVPKNKRTAVYYFELAANMGDPDAQNDLGFCYYHGVGVKKDAYKAAKYYRMAHKQGASVMGNSWIFKKKYDSCGV